MSELHTWVVWERRYERAGRFALSAKWKVISSHKTRVAAEVAASRGFNRMLRRASHGAPP